MAWNALSLPGDTKIVGLLDPATDAAGRTGAYVSMKNYTRATIICRVQQGNAATVAWSVLQATAVAGTGSKAGPTVKVWANLDESVNDTLVAETDGSSYTTDAALKNKMVVFQIDAEQLDGANGFDCIGISTGASNVANVTDAVVILSGSRFAQATPPTAVVD